MIIKYGMGKSIIDVTTICFTKLVNNGIVLIPSGDNNRAELFTDPCWGTKKSIFIIDSSHNDITEYPDNLLLRIENDQVSTFDENDITEKLKSIHSNLKLDYGSLNDELPEQRMAIRYLTGTEKILEIGGNIGRNSLVIAYLLNKNGNTDMVTLESSKDIAKQLIHNRNINNVDFYIESSALSNRKLIQRKWDTIVSDELLDGYFPVDTITHDDLYIKYGIDFDTLVLDCEGAFYYILMDTPEILDNINLIIMENDYHDISHKEYVDSVLIKNKFIRYYTEPLHNGGNLFPGCYKNFFEVWRKIK
jgi:FkbM family methyltransferase